MSIYPRAYVGLPLTADFWNASREDYTIKGSDTARVNNTVTADPELSGIAIPTGTHLIRVRYNYKLAANPANNASVRFRTNWQFSGTWSGTKFGHGPSAFNTEAGGTNTRAKYISGALTTLQGYGVYETFGQDIFEEGIITVTVAGNFDIIWAQEVTTAGNALTLSAGSFVSWKRII